jgi:hypothetical protein
MLQLMRSQRALCRFVRVLLVVALLVDGLRETAWAQQPAAQRAERPPPINLPLPPMHLPPTPPQGSAAIKPRIAATPSFTLDDAKQFVAEHPMLRTVNPKVGAAITDAEFLTSAEVSARLGDLTTGFPHDYLLCLVELRGPFVFPGPAGANAVYDRGVLVFDAASGNLVISGGMP